MKKILITLMTVLALTAFTACESKGVETAEETTGVTSEKTETFKGTGYTLVVDSEKWVFDSEKGDIEDDAFFNHTSDMASLFKVKITQIAEQKNFDMSRFDDAFKEQFEQSNELNYLHGEVININGYDCFKGHFFSNEVICGENVLVNQYVILNGTSMYAFTCTSTEGKFDIVCSDFEEVLNSISFE